ncbi:SDR family oxidoreductase [Hydrogenophaga sp. BPS33]|uniref:SDR family oxidoreductase n=1 Tax=Hydrogenophaga sp. BPS33 TaxID=2651974 RepID=UPI00131F98CB|nr:SDR family oxidoreductase [Hydrogenophaga sp. BPS33]QHE85518.1 SDR family oxidoreductase [Hydrogenophaga sp. BPS33]
MDLGIAGKKALVCGASSGLGYACAEALVKDGVHVVIAARTEGPLREAAERLAAHGAGRVDWIAADVTADEGRARIFAAHPAFDILITNAGGPAPGDFRQWDRETWHKAIDANMLAPIELIKATVDGMMARGFGRIINLTSSAVKSPVDGLGLSTGARSGLTGFVASLARSTVARGVTINNLLPGAFDTARLASNFAAQAQREGKTPEEVRSARFAKHPAHRPGQPSELGHTCAYLCSVHAGYINGQNILIDGGSFNGVF